MYLSIDGMKAHVAYRQEQLMKEKVLIKPSKKKGKKESCCNTTSSKPVTCC